MRPSDCAEAWAPPPRRRRLEPTSSTGDTPFTHCGFCGSPSPGFDLRVADRFGFALNRGPVPAQAGTTGLVQIRWDGARLRATSTFLAATAPVFPSNLLVHSLRGGDGWGRGGGRRGGRGGGGAGGGGGGAGSGGGRGGRGGGAGGGGGEGGGAGGGG